MESISIIDGLALTVVSMLVVFSILAAIWGLIELISKFTADSDPQTDTIGETKTKPGPRPTPSSTETDTLTPNPKQHQVAELIALVLASEDEPDKKFEIVESERIK